LSVRSLGLFIYLIDWWCDPEHPSQGLAELLVAYLAAGEWTFRESLEQVLIGAQGVRQ
jgi:hypothetical protein